MDDLKKLIFKIPNQLGEKIGIENENELPKNPSSVVVCGMGGSGILGNLLHAILPEVDITLNKNYILPKKVKENTLFLMVSYSGNTAETLSCYRQARVSNLPLAVISGGGELLSYTKDDNAPHISIPWKKNVPARFSVGYLLRASLEIFESVELINSLKKQIVDFTEEVKTDWSGEVSSLATQLVGKTVLIYTSPELLGLAKIWKEGLNETAKIPAFVNEIPEMTHNEIESLDSMSDRFIILLKDPQEDLQVLKHIVLTEKLLSQKNWPHIVISLDHKKRIVDLLDSTTFALLTSLALAEIRGVDPRETPIINELKRKLKE